MLLSSIGERAQNDQSERAKSEQRIYLFWWDRRKWLRLNLNLFNVAEFWISDDKEFQNWTAEKLNAQLSNLKVHVLMNPHVRLDVRFY